jgi:hypothetical protein
VKFFVSRIRGLLLPALILAAAAYVEPSARAQTSSPSPTNQEKLAQPPAAARPQGETARERRAQAYAKLLEGQRYLSDLKREGVA